MDVALIIGLSASLQLLAALAALWQIRFTGIAPAWICISAAFSFQAFRRFVALYRYHVGGPLWLAETLTDSLIGLLITLFLTAGVFLITPLLQSIKRSQEVLRRSTEDLEQAVADRTGELQVANKQLQSELQQRRQAEKNLSDERRRLFTLLDRLPPFIYLKGPDYAVQFGNRTFRELFGQPGEKRCYEAIAGRENPCEDCPSLKVLETGKPEKSEFSWNGQTYNIHHYPFADLDGSPLVLTMGFNVTEYKRMVEALQKSEAHLAEAQGIARLGSWEWNLVANKLTVSPAVYDIFLLRPEEIKLTSDLFFEQLLHPEDTAGVQASLEAALAGKEAYNLDYRLILPGGRERVAHAQGEVYPDETGLAERMAGTVQDVTEIRAVEAALKESEKNLRFLASRLMSAQEMERKRVSRELHDELGQSLLVLKLQLRAVERRLNQGDLKDDCEALLAYLEGIVDKVRRLSRALSPAIIEDLGLVAAIQHMIKKLCEHYQVAECSMAIDDVDHLFDQEARINIYRIFQETLTNIGKYAQADWVEVAIKKDPEQVFFQIADNGRGFNLTEVLARDTDNRGLGLTAMDERVRMLGGALRIWSQEGAGTRISFNIPIPE